MLRAWAHLPEASCSQENLNTSTSVCGSLHHSCTHLSCCAPRSHVMGRGSICQRPQVLKKNRTRLCLIMSCICLCCCACRPLVMSKRLLPKAVSAPKQTWTRLCLSADFHTTFYIICLYFGHADHMLCASGRDLAKASCSQEHLNLSMSVWWFPDYFCICLCCCACVPHVVGGGFSWRPGVLTHSLHLVYVCRLISLSCLHMLICSACRAHVTRGCHLAMASWSQETLSLFWLSVDFHNSFCMSLCCCACRPHVTGRRHLPKALCAQENSNLSMSVCSFP